MNTKTYTRKYCSNNEIALYPWITLYPWVSNTTTIATYIPNTLHPIYAIQLHRVPFEYFTHHGVYDLIEEVLKIGKVNNIVLNQDGSAVIFLHYWFHTANGINLSEKIAMIESNTIPLLNVPRIMAFLSNNLLSEYPLLFPNFNENIVNYLEFSAFHLQQTMMMPPPPPPPPEPLHINFLQKQQQQQQQQEPEYCQKILEMSDNEWTSLYIPMIPTDMLLEGRPFTHEDLEDYIENKIQIGKVRRIDFVDRDDMESYDEETNPVKAAFIHMNCWYDNYNANMLRNALNSKGDMRERGYYNGTRMIRFETTKSENMNRYLVFKINHKPIPDADGKLNIHQLAALKTKYEAEIEQMKQELDLLKNPQQPPNTPEQNEDCFMNHLIFDSFTKSSLV
jgi:hypothetical protein